MDPIGTTVTSTNTPTIVDTVPVSPQIPTPVSPPQLVEYAGFGRRLSAFLIDSFIIWIIAFLISLVFGSNQSSSGSVGFSLTGFPALVVNFLVITYYIYFTGRYGQTIGKKVLKIKVVKLADCTIPGFLTAFLREFVGKFLSVLILALGYFWMIWDPKKQTWHDKIASTIVIKSS